MADKEFAKGLIVKSPPEKAPDFVKCKISIRRVELMEWLASKSEEWVNLQVKTSAKGVWYTEVDNWKPAAKMDKDIPF